jgi:enoyl-CoA hydratase
MVDYSGYEHILAERDGNILTLTLNRPDRMNAVNGRLHTELSTIFREVNRDNEAWAVILTGAGRAFCAGGDIGGMASSESGSNLEHRVAEVRGEAQEIVYSILDLEKPLVGKINGAAVGLGATVALLCDVVVASVKARIGDRHVNVGLVAGDGGAVIWPWLVGINKAKELLMTGELIQGDDLARLGIVNHLVDSEELDAFCLTKARELAGMAPYAARATKQTLNKILKKQAEEVMDVGLAWEWLSMRQDDHREATSAFVEKREAHFKGT